MELKAVGGHIEAGEDGWWEEAPEAVADDRAKDSPGNMAGVAGCDEDGKVGVAGVEVVPEKADGVEADYEIEEDERDKKGEVEHGGTGRAGGYDGALCLRTWRDGGPRAEVIGERNL